MWQLWQLSTSMLLLILLEVQLITPSTAVLSGLPRFNFYTQSFESSDLGSYQTFDCEGGVTSVDPSKDRSCTFNTDTDGEFVAYAGGAGFYTIIGLLAGVLLLLGSYFFLLFSILKLFCCCSNGEKKIRAGIKPIPVVSFFTCMVMIVVCCCISTFSGNYAITENTSANDDYNAANSLYGLQNIVHTFEPSATKSIMALTSDVLRPAMLQTNKTLNKAVSIHELITAFQILNTTVPKLPDAHAVVEELNVTETIVHNSSDYLDLILINLDDIDELVEGLHNDTRALYNYTKDLNALNDDISDKISDLNTSVILTLDFLNDIVGDDGVVESCVSDLRAIQRVDNGGMLPNSAVFYEASEGAVGSTSLLNDGTLDGNSAEITLLTEKLVAIDQNISALPNYTLTADQLVYLNTSINDALAPNGLISNLTRHMTALDASIQGPVPTLIEILSSIASFQTTVDGLTDEMADTLHVLNILLPLIETLLPQFEFLEAEVLKMYVAEELLPVIDIMLKQFVSINATLFELPTVMEDAIDSMHDVNTTLQDFLYNGTLSDILGALDDANETVTDALDQAEAELTNLEDFQDELLNATTGYNISSINDTVVEAINLLESIDFNDTYQKILDFEDSLASVQIDESFVDSLYELQGKLDTFLGMLDRAVGPSGDYVLLAQGYCTGLESVYCVVDADCVSEGGTTCAAASVGSYRCASPIGGTTCTVDSDCASSYCLADSTRGSTLHATLVGFANNSTDLEVDVILSELEEILVSSDVNLTDSTKMLDDGAESIAVFNTSDVFALIVDIESGIDEFDTVSIRDQMTSTQESIDDVDFKSLVDQIDSNLDIYDRVANNTFIEKWIDTFETVKDFLFNENYFHKYLANMESSVLSEQLELSGPVGAMSHIGAQADHSMNDFRQNQTGIDVGDEPDESYSSRGDDFKVLDKAGGSRYATTRYATNDLHGALYYLFALGNNFTFGQTRSVPHDHPLARGIVANSEGFRYEDDSHTDDNNDDSSADSVYCFTLDCFEYTMDIVNTAPLSEVNDELFPPSYDSEEDDNDSVLSSVDISREEMMTLLWVPVLVLLLIGVCAFGAAFVPKLHKMHVGCNCCFLSCALLIVPFIFIFASFFMVLVIVGEDSCTTGTAIGETYISDFGDEYCTQTLGGTGTLADCKFNWTMPEQFGDDVNMTISFNVLDTYNALFQKKCDVDVDPFEKISLDLAEQVRLLPLQATQKGLKSYDLRPALEAIANTTAVNTGQLLYDLIAETHVDGDRKVMSCESLSLVYADVQDTGCEGVVLPAAWLIGSWYLVAWSICCCGIPASCATLTKMKIVDNDFEIAGSEDESSSGDDEEEEEEGDGVSEYDEEEEEGGVQMQTRKVPQEDGPSSEEEEEFRQPSPATLVRPPPGVAGATQVSGNTPRSSKEEWVNADAYRPNSAGSYINRSKDSARAMGLASGDPNDSRFQTSRSTRASDEALL